ncbi:MAG TPA: MGMT family protein [Candidatus Nanoarchaeia archaeon]|uniref:Methylated-DNA--protein-cysteine methyltransferase, methylated-DNA-[protein]-cysteine S-methyltransferase n=1 Tax=uncultured archaeon Rifle_16ft_4_minimus_37913 TaxID=1665152 RepID=A0A0H4T970_9ARCH|nr:methylated-DNA--protein-cysteine methyltransferase, methylated-DNA-[protein]-cysteine S-methyltransferase [uncultured archaeon Rifle_16ft_4_minimus_37913]HKZ33941.1 MGMT family protein [Candidatus Nanoarchaeia archaeon]
MKNSFAERCYKILRKVPRGKVTTYGEIAKALKSNAYRAVGNAMNKNPFPGSKVPCHRVVKSNGEVGGFASETGKKVSMLKEEGINIVEGKIDLGKYLYKF